MPKLHALCLVAAVSACGGDNKNYGAPIVVDESVKAAAEDAVAGAASVTTLTATPDDSSLSAFGNVFNDVNEIVQAKMAATSGTHQVAAAILHKALASAPADITCATVSANQVTFNHCSVEGITLDGSITFGSGHFTINITAQGSADGLNLGISENGAIDASATVVSGALNVAANVNGSTSGVNVTGNISYATSLGVTLTDHCATAGQLEAHAAVSVHGSSSGTTVNEDANLWVKAVFGPACHTVTIY